MKKRFTDEQIIGFLKQAAAGAPIKELCRKHGFSDASFYLWRQKFGRQVRDTHHSTQYHAAAGQGHPSFHAVPRSTGTPIIQPNPTSSREVFRRIARYSPATLRP